MLRNPEQKLNDESILRASQQLGATQHVLDTYTVYVSGNYVVKFHEEYGDASKHYYMGAQRVATNLGTYEPPISGPGGPSSGFKRQNSTHPLVSNLTDILSELRLDATHEYNAAALITRADYATYHGTTDSAQAHKTED